MMCVCALAQILALVRTQKKKMKCIAALSPDCGVRSEQHAYKFIEEKLHLRVYFPQRLLSMQDAFDLDGLPQMVKEWAGTSRCDVLVTTDEGPSIRTWMWDESIERYPIPVRMRLLMVGIIKALKTIMELRGYGCAHQNAKCQNFAMSGVALTLDAVVLNDLPYRDGPWNEECGIYSSFCRTRDGSDAFSLIESIWQQSPKWVQDPRGCFGIARALAFEPSVLSAAATKSRQKYPCFLNPNDLFSFTNCSVHRVFSECLLNYTFKS